MRRIGKVGAILALGLTVNLAASDTFFSSTQEETNNHLQVNAGVIDLKHLDKKEGFVDIRYQGSSLTFLDSYSVAKIKLSSSYKDFWLANPILVSPIYSFDGSGVLGATTGVGYMMLDSKKYVHSTDPHILSTNEKETQKAPYISFNAFAGYLLNEDMALSSSLVYKVAVDRADMKDGYSAGLKIEYKNWNLSLEHEKFDFKGVDDGENNSAKLGYTFIF